MDGLSLIDELRSAGLDVWVEGHQLNITGEPTAQAEALLEKLRVHKNEVLDALQGPDRWHQFSEVTQREDGLIAPVVRFRLCETEDIEMDVVWLARIRRLIEEYQPGDSSIVMTVMTLTGQRVRVEWKALGSKGLRLSLAQLLARRHWNQVHGRTCLDAEKRPW